MKRDAFFESGSVGGVTIKIMDSILCRAKMYVLIREYSFLKSSHLWLNTKCYELLAQKHAAEGTLGYNAARDACTQGLQEEFQCHANRMKTKISGLPSSSKKW